MSKTNAEKQALIDQLRKSPIVQVCCEKTGIARSTYYRWRKDDSDFAEQSDKALAEGVLLINDMAESQLLSSIKDKNMTGIIFWLKHHHKAYETRVRVDAKVQTIKQELTSDQEELVSRALRLSGLLNEENDDGE